MDRIKLLFENKMYLISLLPFLFLIRFSSDIENFGINKTVGWAYDLTNFRYFIVYILLMFFVLFSFLAIIRAKTNFILSLIFFLLISFCSLFHNGYQNVLLIDYILLFSIFLFIIIFLNSIYIKIKQRFM